jgi:hypothetical protein
MISKLAERFEFLRTLYDTTRHLNGCVCYFFDNTVEEDVGYCESCLIPLLLKMVKACRCVQYSVSNIGMHALDMHPSTAYAK